MKLLYVLRHAKSSWDDPAIDDFERPLAQRGRREARQLRKQIRRERVRPSRILCSPSRRTRQTLRLLKPALGPDVPIQFDSHLYLAGAEDLLRRLRKLPKRLSSVMVIGHNPSLQELVLTLARPGKARAPIEAIFPPGALATLRLRGSRWRKLRPGAAKIVAYITPRQPG